jgi:hypothetical protein
MGAPASACVCAKHGAVRCGVHGLITPEMRADPRYRTTVTRSCFEVSFLVGPCEREEAEALLVELSFVVAGRLGAVGSLAPWNESGGASG